jgi:hypothetical protein
MDRAKEIDETWKKMPHDPAQVATAMDYYSKHLDELLQKELAFMALWTDVEVDYTEKLRKRLHELIEKDGLPIGKAKAQAQAEFIEERTLTHKAATIHKVYARIRRRLEQRRYDA